MSSLKHTPTIAITLGDPGGIGPEVIAKSLADATLRGMSNWVVVGSYAVMRSACQRWAPDVTLQLGDDASNGTHARGTDRVLMRDSGVWTNDATPLREPAGAQGAASLAWVCEAIAGAKAGAYQGVVTGPISKEAWALAGEARFAGHTELFAESFGSPPHAMMFVSPALCVILTTIHVPLARVPALLTPERVLATLRLGDATCRRLGLHQENASPRIAVCGVNPHAGENGLIGTEDAAAITPAIVQARAEGIDAHGPFPGDTIFHKAVTRPGGPSPRYDLVVAMYHDQGLIPLKLLAFDAAVNMTVGLPIVRTSPDHGTAFDIAGTGIADPGSMKSAMHMAVRLAGA
jgi:4-hydroxythreonine-4-phosphate dehydrogenase